MAHFGILSSFDHNTQSWQNYKQRISQWFIANDVDDARDPQGVKRRAILLSALTDSTYKLAADLALPKELTQTPYEDILSLLDRHFSPKKCGFGERYNFYAATQGLEETFSQWAARLRGLTTHCGFLNVEEALCDRFVMGTLPGPEKDKLFACDLQVLTLAKAVDLAESVRSARKGAAASSAASAQSPSSSEALFKIATTNEPSASANKEKCSVCGYKNHKTSQCRFANYTCKKCNVKGHLRRMCKKVNYVGNDGSSETDDDGRRIQKIYSRSGEPMTIIVSIQNIKVKFEVDTGSAVTAISEKMYRKHFESFPLLPTSDRLFTYTGRTISCLGSMQLPITYLDKTHVVKVRVIRDGGPPIVGRDFICLFKLQMLQINYCQSNKIANQLKVQYPSVFSDELGLFTKYRVKLQLKENAKPFFFKARPIAFALRDKINDELDRLVRIGVLKPVQHSDYASPIVPILKRDGSIRLCVDYSVSVNKQLVIEQYPLPTAQELFTKLHGGQQFSKLDLTQAYSQFVLDEESQKLTCINTHRGLFVYTRLVFGLASAPAIFQRAMECLLSGLDGVMCMLDDICITGDTKEQHLERLSAVLQRLQDAGLTLRKDKCVFFENQIEYLGYTIDKNGLSKSKQKVQAIVEAPTPTNINKLQSFLGLVNYYRNFVPNASSILSPLYSLLQKGNKWKWDVTHDQAFNAIKRCLASNQVLAHFDQNAKIILTVDASPSG